MSRIVAVFVCGVTVALAAPSRVRSSATKASLAASSAPQRVALVESIGHGQVELSCNDASPQMSCTVKRVDDGQTATATVKVGVPARKTERLYVVSSAWTGPMEMAVEVATGIIFKGPFRRGAQIRFRPLRGSDRTQPYTVFTVDHLGAYRTPFPLRGPTWVEASGRFYDEAAGRVSDGPITLDALHMPGTPRDVTLLTHLSAPRAFRLMDTMAPRLAVARARQEVATALRLTGRDVDADLFRLGTVFTHVAGARARRDGGSASQLLQDLVDGLAADFADDGRLNPSSAKALQDASATVDLVGAQVTYERYLDAVGGSAQAVAARLN